MAASPDQGVAVFADFSDYNGHFPTGRPRTLTPHCFDKYEVAATVAERIERARRASRATGPTGPSSS